MTDAESITVDLEHAKELRTAGWPQDSYFLWTKSSRADSFWRLTKEYQLPQLKTNLVRATRQFAAAPTAEEILRRLPTGLKIEKVELGGLGSWTICLNAKSVNRETLANAAAALWICLKENNLLPTDAPL